MKVARKQHYVWKKYLRAWCNTNEQLYCSFNKSKPIKTSLMNVANKRDFYKLKKLNAFEIDFIKYIIYKQLPKEMADEFIKWINFYNSIYYLEDLSKFFLLNQVIFSKMIEEYKIQSEEYRQGHYEINGIKYIDNILNENIKYCLLEKNIMRFYIFICEQYFRTKRIFDDLVHVQDKNEKSEIDFENIIIPMRHIMSYNLGYTMYMEKYKTLLLKNKTIQEFITSDQPIVNMFVNYSAKNKHTDKLEFYYPISKTLAILVLKDTPHENGDTVFLTLDDIDRYNKKIIEASQNQIYCSTENALDRYINNINHIAQKI